MTSPRRIDLHTHFLPDGYRKVLARHGQDTIAGTPVPEWSADLHQEFMREWGIDTAVVSISDPGVYFGDVGEARETARLVNEEGAALIRANPDRWGALATLPLPDLDGALAELQHALDELELDGVALLSSVDGVYLGDPSLADLYEELDRRRAMVFVHPAVPNERPALVYPPFLFEFTFDTTRAFVNLMYLGVFKNYPNIRWVFAHGGGTLPYLAFRMSLGAFNELVAGNVPDGPPAYYARAYYDTALSYAPSAIASLREVAPLDHIAFGSDWPFARQLFEVPASDVPEWGAHLVPRDGDPAPALRDLSEAERAQIDRGTAGDLLPRLALTTISSSVDRSV
jgi:predicted TIM-barrel fold metal-dependent hydrolase